MDFDEYEALARKTLVSQEDRALRLFDFGLGIAGEAGEVAEKLKKLIRDDHGELTEERREALKKEMGDVLWYLSQLSRELGFKFSEVAETNIRHLADRAARDRIHGSGDNR